MTMYNAKVYSNTIRETVEQTNGALSSELPPSVKSPFRSALDHCSRGPCHEASGMIRAGQPIIEDLEPRDVDNLQARCGPARVRAIGNAVWRNNPLERARLDNIQIDVSLRALSPSPDGLAGRLWLIVGALIAASGWAVISVLLLPFASAPVDKQRASSAASADASDFRKGDRLHIAKAIVREPASTESRGTSAIVAAATPSQRQSSTQPQQQKTGQANKAAHPRALIKAKARDREPPVQSSPAPETRPTTIEGWMLRDVTNGTALLQGPNGIWRAARGDAVPGLGRVDSIFKWGDRLMVALVKV
jgi:hypothetical protein